MREGTLPVIEVFGPTIAGEGALAGRQTHFVRLGLCDYRCSWCDSMHAVDPELVRANARQMTAGQIVDELISLDLPAAGHDTRLTPWVSISGGNPAIHAGVDPLVSVLHAHGYLVNVETQGSRWQSWLERCDMVTVSPKPPSSGMDRKENPEVLRRILALPRSNLKVVVFDEEDFQYARRTVIGYCDQDDRSWLSVGTKPTDSAQDVLDRYRWLVERTLADPELSSVGILPQIHVLLWGHAQGV